MEAVWCELVSTHEQGNLQGKAPNSIKLPTGGRGPRAERRPFTGLFPYFSKQGILKVETRILVGRSHGKQGTCTIAPSCPGWDKCYRSIKDAPSLIPLLDRGGQCCRIPVPPAVGDRPLAQIDWRVLRRPADQLVTRTPSLKRTVPGLPSISTKVACRSW